MTQIFDLFGEPVPANWGMRGRPEHIPTQQNRNKVSILVAFGWSNGRIAKSLFITIPTLRKYYFSELKFRDVARDRLDAGLAVKLWEQVQAGNVGAMKEFQKLLERNDLMTSHLNAHGPQAADRQAKQPKLGKKELARLAAHHPDTETTMGDLIAQRQSAPDKSVN